MHVRCRISCIGSVALAPPPRRPGRTPWHNIAKGNRHRIFSMPFQSNASQTRTFVHSLGVCWLAAGFAFLRAAGLRCTQRCRRAERFESSPSNCVKGEAAAEASCKEKQSSRAALALALALALASLGWVAQQRAENRGRFLRYAETSSCCHGVRTDIPGENHGF